MNSLILLTKELIHLYRVVDRKTFLVYLKSITMNLSEIVRKKSLMPADRMMAGRNCVFKVNKKHVILEGVFFGLAREIYSKRNYFTLPGFEINENDTIVDLGANAGVFTLLAALCGSKVIAVDAQSGFKEVIEKNVNNNGCSEKVNFVSGIVGANSGVVSDPFKRKSASHYIDKTPEISLPEIITRFNLNKIDFLKVDIEGSEFALFSDNNEWLSLVDKIAMEVHPEFGDVKSLGTLLVKKGFNVWYVNKNQQIVDELTTQGFLFAKNLHPLQGDKDGSK
jgi:FkbM family methyltransferase